MEKRELRERPVPIVYPFQFRETMRPTECESSGLYTRATRYDTWRIAGLGDFAPTMRPTLGHALFAREIGDVAQPTHIVLKPLRWSPDGDMAWLSQLAFVREIEILREMEGEDVPKAYGFAHSQLAGTYSITEHLQGTTLDSFISLREAERARGEQVDEGYYLSIMTNAFIAAARTVDRAHQKGIIHRDVKPGNIVIKEDSGQVVLADWNSAFREGGREDVYQLNVGTAYYCPIEQMGDTAPVRASDIAGLGKTLYRIFGGTFDAPNNIIGTYFFLSEDLVEDMRRSHPSKKSTNIADIILRATAYNAADRYQSVDEFLAELIPCLQEIVMNTIGDNISQALMDEHAHRRVTRELLPTRIMDASELPSGPLPPLA